MPAINIMPIRLIPENMSNSIKLSFGVAVEDIEKKVRVTKNDIQ